MVVPLAELPAELLLLLDFRPLQSSASFLLLPFLAGGGVEFRGLLCDQNGFFARNYKREHMCQKQTHAQTHTQNAYAQHPQTEQNLSSQGSLASFQVQRATDQTAPAHDSHAKLRCQFIAHSSTLFNKTIPNEDWDCDHSSVHLFAIGQG